MGIFRSADWSNSKGQTWGSFLLDEMPQVIGKSWIFDWLTPLRVWKFPLVDQGFVAARVGVLSVGGEPMISRNLVFKRPEGYDVAVLWTLQVVQSFSFDDPNFFSLQVFPLTQ